MGIAAQFIGEAICFEGYDLYLTNEARDIYALSQFFGTGWNQVLCSVRQNGWTEALYLRFTDAAQWSKMDRLCCFGSFMFGVLTC